MNYLSVCSGIEAATVAWHPLGWKPAAFSEIEKFPRQVLAHHYPHVPLHGDFTTIKGDEYGSVNLLVGGTPCQSFSVAGLRKGLDDPRGNLMLEYGSLARRLGAKWLVWENVPGVLSANRGRDFGTFLGMLAELGYGFAYRVLDAQYFGVAQRRRRVFVVGYLGDWRRAAAVLFERDSLCGNPAPSRKAGESITHSIAPCLTSSGRGIERAGDTRGQDPVVAVAFGGNNQSGPIEVATARNACASGSGRMDFESETFLVQPTIVHGTQDPCVSDIAFAQGRNNGGENVLINPMVFDAQQITSAVNRTRVDPVLPSSTIAKKSRMHVAYTTKLHNTGSNNAGKIFEERTTCLDANSPAPALLTAMQVRRLTPVECERLQGFPDNYTDIQPNGKPTPDGPRYKALGNSMAVPVMAWIGKRIAQVEAI